jgi:VWFA-related protein
MRKALLPLFLPLLLVPSAFSQTGPEVAETPTIFANTNEVSQDLVVRDHKNKCVVDLKPEDIAISDNGSPVKIASLRFVTEKSQVARSITLLFGQLDPSAATNASEIAIKILKMVPETGFSISVLNISGRLRLFQEFTSDRAALRKAVNMATGSVTIENAADIAAPERNLMAEAETGKSLSGSDISSPERGTARIMLMTLQEAQRIMQDQHAQPSLSALLALARTQRKISGRKAIVYFAQSLPDDVTNEEMLRSIIGAANRSGVSLYVINANGQDSRATEGMIASGAVTAAATARELAPSGGNALPPGLRPASTTVGSQLNRLQMDGLAVREDPLDTLSLSTGGVYVSAGESVKKPLQQLVEDMTTYYEASYVPALGDYTGRFRPVTVRAVRAGLDIRSRAGYFALPPGTDSNVRPFETPLLKLLAEPHPPSNLEFRSGIVRLGELPDGNANALVVEVPLKELKVQKDTDERSFSVHLSIVAEIQDKSGTTIEHFSEDLPRHEAKEVFDTATDSDVITMQRHFIAAPGPYTLQVAIEDRNSGKAAVKRIDFEIPDVSSGPSLSDLSIVRRTDQFTWEADPLEPLRYENSKVIPNISGAVDRAARLLSFFFIVHPDVHGSEHAKLEMAVLKNGQAIAKLPLPVRKTTGEGALPYLASIRAGSLAPGIYEVKETLTQDGKSTDSSVSFKIEAAK